ncbi:sugar-binding transcriptional regulator [Sporosalibacterium faouarense]|uniref:sugar-binding transcriptional regulator n=1 Tax=Sporosalibacterium faouarense TaxID=516123 RepID=UPI00141C8AED|nr:sugar-binding domain-containing protein [Sporosalibacterium faouarense]MTI46964.1 sugar-binding transcriptional regulator [Bacillota bacterium]
MDEILELQKKILPELTEILEKRYNILRNIYYNQPVGRRTLANKIGIGERVIRTEVNVLREQNLVEINPLGMTVTDEGQIIVDKLKDFIHSLKDLKSLESKLEKVLNIKKILVVPGSFDEDEYILKDVGKTSSLCIKTMLKDNNIIGITGGSTMAQVANEMPKQDIHSNILVIPARGGLGKNFESQANNVAVNLAKKLGGSYKLLHVPDSLDKEALDTIIQIPEVKELKNLIKKIDVLVFGLGNAEEMANRRMIPDDKIKEILEKGAVAEAFGYYFNTKGEQVWESSTVGLSLDDFKKVKNVVGVACGKKKAEAIIAISSLKKDMTLIMDEGVAREIIEIVK